MRTLYRKALEEAIRALPPGAKILDVGCYGFKIEAFCRANHLNSLVHYGVDYQSYGEVPKNLVFKQVNLDNEQLPFKDDFFDLVIGSHVIEHLKEPLAFFAECIRVCKPQARLYLEAPSERSLLLPGMPFGFEEHRSLSFYDDPTHQYRPWSPQAFYRLAKMYRCHPLQAKYLWTKRHRFLCPLLLLYALVFKDAARLQTTLWNALGWASYLLVEKPADLNGAPSFRYC